MNGHTWVRRNSNHALAHAFGPLGSWELRLLPSGASSPQPWSRLTSTRRCCSGRAMTRRSARGVGATFSIQPGRASRPQRQHQQRHQHRGTPPSVSGRPLGLSSTTRRQTTRLPQLPHLGQEAISPRGRCCTTPSCRRARRLLRRCRTRRELRARLVATSRVLPIRRCSCRPDTIRLPSSRRCTRRATNQPRATSTIR